MCEDFLFSRPQIYGSHLEPAVDRDLGAINVMWPEPNLPTARASYLRSACVCWQTRMTPSRRRLTIFILTLWLVPVSFQHTSRQWRKLSLSMALAVLSALSSHSLALTTVTQSGRRPLSQLMVSWWSSLPRGHKLTIFIVSSHTDLPTYQCNLYVQVHHLWTQA